MHLYRFHSLSCLLRFDLPSYRFTYNPVDERYIQERAVVADTGMHSSVRWTWIVC